MNQNCNYLYFQASQSSHSFCYVGSRRPFVTIVISSVVLVGCQNVISTTKKACWRWYNGNERTTGTNITMSTTNKTCYRWYNDNKRTTGINISNWMERHWSLKMKVISVLIIIEIFPSVLETWYLKTLITGQTIKSSPKLPPFAILTAPCSKRDSKDLILKYLCSSLHKRLCFTSISQNR